MWRRRSFVVARASIVGALLGRSQSRRLLRFGVFGLILATTVGWPRGSLAISIRGTSASVGVVESFSAANATLASQLNASPSVATTAGDLLVDVVQVRNATVASTVTGITDSGGNAWVKAGSAQRHEADEELWYAVSSTSISSLGFVTVTTSAPSAIAMTVIDVSGIAASAPLDVVSTNTGASTTPSSGTTAATINASEIAVAGIGWIKPSSPSGQSAGYRPLATTESTVSGLVTGEQAATKVLSATGTQSYAATLSTDVPWTAIIATFQASSTPPTPTPSATATPTPTATPTGTPTPSPTPSGTPIKHVVVIYQENHSFDEVLGDWCFTTSRCNGYDVTKPVTLKGGLQKTMMVSPDVVPNVNHSVASQLTAVDGGLMDGWAGVQGCGATSNMSGAIPYGCLTYFTPSQIPNLIALATKFAVSDRTFSMADSPSWGGHVYAVAATTDHFNGNNPIPPSPKPSGWIAGPGWGCNSNLVTNWINPSNGASSLQPSCIPDPSIGRANGGAFEPTTAQYVPTIMDELDAAAISWRIYDPSANNIWAVCPSFAECEYGPQQTDVVPNTQVLSDASSGTLPAFSLVIPATNTSQHNTNSMTAGDNWIGQVVSAIENGPDWGSTAIFITYDDCGCFYDHVTPGTNPDGTQDGVREPMVIVSPYARAGYTDSTPASFASILAYTEQALGVAPLSVNDAGAYAFANAFDYSQTPLAPVAMRQQPISLAEQQYLAAHPGNPDDPT
jgi:phospholipase C